MLLCQIVGNGSEQQLQRELEDVLMDPSVAGMDSLDLAAPGSDPLSELPPKLEMALPVQTAQESELNERSYRGELTNVTFCGFLGFKWFPWSFECQKYPSLLQTRTFNVFLFCS